jgi:hypothetical protein
MAWHDMGLVLAVMMSSEMADVICVFVSRT